MTFPWRLTIPGKPVGWPRQRHRVVGPKAGPIKAFHATSYTPRDGPHVAWKDEAVLRARAAWSGPPIEGPVSCQVLAVFRRPKALPQRLGDARSHPGRLLRDAKPDDDNVAKAVRDALTAAGVWQDDCQVFGLTLPVWGAPGEDPHVLIEVSPAGYRLADTLWLETTTEEG